jgi:hypothetical protein
MAQSESSLFTKSEDENLAMSPLSLSTSLQTARKSWGGVMQPIMLRHIELITHQPTVNQRGKFSLFVKFSAMKIFYNLDATWAIVNITGKHMH